MSPQSINDKKEYKDIYNIDIYKDTGLENQTSSSCASCGQNINNNNLYNNILKKESVNNLLTVNNINILNYISKDTKPFAIRIPYYHYILYNNFNKEKQALIREILKNTFIKAVEDIEGIKPVPQEEKVVIPIQININNVNHTETNTININALQNELEALRLENKALWRRIKSYEKIIKLEGETQEKQEDNGEWKERFKALYNDLVTLVYGESSKYVLREDLRKLLDKHRVNI